MERGTPEGAYLHLLRRLVGHMWQGHTSFGRGFACALVVIYSTGTSKTIGDKVVSR